VDSRRHSPYQARRAPVLVPDNDLDVAVTDRTRVVLLIDVEGGASAGDGQNSSPDSRSASSPAVRAIT